MQCNINTPPPLHCNTTRDFKLVAAVQRKMAAPQCPGWFMWAVTLEMDTSGQREPLPSFSFLFLFFFFLFFLTFLCKYFFSILFFNKHFKTASLCVGLSIWFKCEWRSHTSLGTGWQPPVAKKTWIFLDFCEFEWLLGEIGWKGHAWIEWKMSANTK